MTTINSSSINADGAKTTGKVSDTSMLNPETATLKEHTAALRKLLKAAPNNPSKLDADCVTIQQSTTVPNNIAFCYIANATSDTTASTLKAFDNWTRPFRKSDSIGYGEFRQDKQVEFIAETWMTPAKFATALNEKLAQQSAARG